MTSRASVRLRLLLAVFLIAIGVRWVVLDGMEAYPRFEKIKNRLDDQVVFDLWAKTTAAGEPFDYAVTGHEFAHWAAAQPGVYPQSPLYPWWITTNYRLFGPNYDTVRWLQMVLGAFGCVLLVLVARRFVSSWGAVVCGLVMAFYGPLVFYEGTYLRAAVITPVLLAGMALALAASESVGRRRPWLAGATGLGLALLVLLRPNNLLVAAVVLLWLLWRWKAPGTHRVERRSSPHPLAPSPEGGRGGTGKDAEGVAPDIAGDPSGPSGPLAPHRGERVGVRGVLQPAALFALFLMLPLLAVATLNTVRSGSPAFLSSNGPYILFVSNVHDATGLSAGPSPYYFEVKAKGPAESVDLVAETLADVRRHPGAWLRLEARKLLAFFAPQEIPNNLSYAMARKTNPLLAWAPIDLRWILPLALVGAVLSLSQWRRFALLHLVLWSTVVATILFYVLARMRLPVVPLLVIFAVFAVEQAIQAVRRRRGLPLLAGVATAVTLGALLWPGEPIHRPTDYAMAAAAEYSVAEELEQADQPEAARLRFARAVALNPEHGEALDRLHRLAYRLGPLSETPTAEVVEACDVARQLAQRGDGDRALDLLRQVVEAAPRTALPRHYQANVHYLRGDKHQALEAMEAAVERAPLDQGLRQSLVALRREIREEP